MENNMKTIKKHKVKIMFRDSWSPQDNEDSYEYYSTKDAAMKAVENVNKHNTSKEVPECYTVAHYDGEVEGVIINKVFKEFK